MDKKSIHIVDKFSLQSYILNKDSVWGIHRIAITYVILSCEYALCPKRYTWFHSNLINQDELKNIQQKKILSLSLWLKLSNCYVTFKLTLLLPMTYGSYDSPSKPLLIQKTVVFAISSRIINCINSEWLTWARTGLLRGYWTMLKIIRKTEEIDKDQVTHTSFSKL